MKGYFWPDERVALLRRMYGKGLTGGQIAAELGCSRSAVLGKAHRLGLHRKPRRTILWSSEMITALKRLRRSGFCIRVCAARLGVGHNAASAKARQLGITGRKSRGAYPGNSPQAMAHRQ